MPAASPTAVLMAPIAHARYSGRVFLCSDWARWRRLMALVVLMGVALMSNSPAYSAAQSSPKGTGIETGAEVLARSGFAMLSGKRVGLITNQTGKVGDRHLVDLMAEAENVRLTAIFAPEHGFRGDVEAGKKVSGRVDEKTGVRVFSLYGDTRKPTQSMLRNIDVLVFDIQDIGVRFYTYISTMGLAMQAAAERGIPFVVLDRPNPLGGTYVSGFVLNPRYTSFVGQYPLPIVHGLTVGELALMIKGEAWLSDLLSLDLIVVKIEGWDRSLRWQDLGRDWVATSPNIPSFESALLYPGIGIVGETAVNEGRGTDGPFTRFGAPWLDADQLAQHLSALQLPGVRFEATVYKPRSIPGVAANPRHLKERVRAVRVFITDPDVVEPLEIGMHALAFLVPEAQKAGVRKFFPNRRMFHLISGDRRLLRQLRAGWSGSRIIASWQEELARFKEKRRRYLIY